MNRGCVREAGFLQGNSAFFVPFISWDGALGCWVSRRFGRHQAIRELHMSFKFSAFRGVPFNPTYGLSHRICYQDFLSPSLFSRLIVVHSLEGSLSHSLSTRLIPSSQLAYLLINSI